MMEISAEDLVITDQTTTTELKIKEEDEEEEELEATEAVAPEGYEEMELEVEVKGVFKQDIDVKADVCQVTSSSDREREGVKIKKVCGVCNRAAKSSHFGALCCDSCKAFFRRSIQTGVWETFLCFKDGQCNVRENRRGCQACRFKQCITIGMDKSLVMPEEERKALMSRKLERKRQLLLEHQRIGKLVDQSNFESQDQETTSMPGTTMDIEFNTPCEPNEFNTPCEPNVRVSPDWDRNESNDCYIAEALSREDKGTILFLQRLLRKALSFPEFPQHYYEKNADIIEHLFFIFCKSMGKFFSSTPEFRGLHVNDQRILLKPAVAKAVFIFGTHQYEHERDCWPRRLLSSSCSFPTIGMPAVEKFIDDEETIFKWKAFIRKNTTFYADEVVMLLSLMIALFDHEESTLIGRLEIAKYKAKFIHLLETYTQQFYPAYPTSAITLQLLASLADVQDLKDCFQKSSTENAATSTSPTLDSPQFSSSFGEGMTLPPKKALHIRNTFVARDKETSDIVFLGEVTAPSYSKRLVKSEEDGFSRRYSFNSVDMWSKRDKCMPAVSDHDYQIISEGRLDSSLIQQTGNSGARNPSSDNANIGLRLAPANSTSKFALDSREKLVHFVGNSCRVKGRNQEPEGVLKHHQQTNTNIVESLAAGLPHQCLIPAPTDLLHRLAMQRLSGFQQMRDVRETIGTSFQERGNAQNRSDLPQMSCESNTSQVSRSSPTDSQDDEKSLSSDDETLLNALKNALPPHLVKVLAKKISRPYQNHV